MNPPTPSSPANTTTEQVIELSGAETVYSNMCRGVMTSEEVILDFALNPNINGRVLDEPIQVKSRVVMSFSSAKRLLHLIHAMVSKHEQTFGEIVLDLNQRVKKTGDSAPTDSAV
jgi:hypothetical protein